MINVTKTFLPPLEEYQSYLKGIWERVWVTNNGQLVTELESKLKEYLSIENLWFTTNGTIPIQMALKALEIKGEVVTTPFSYVATTNAILWENCQPVFVDINPDDFCINADLIEAKITNKTEAILATHVYGFPCEVVKIENIAKRHNLKVIYDAAHAFGVELNGQSLLNFGDISTCSFHATKVFHSVEGGAIVIKDKVLAEKIYWQRQFGHKGDIYKYLGINAKNSEMHAAMGLCMLPKVTEIIRKRKELSQHYNQLLNWEQLYKPQTNQNIKYNFAYYPVVFQSETQMLKVVAQLNHQNIFPRRYFYPSLNTLSFSLGQSCPISEDISSRVLSLPLFYDLAPESIDQISSIINNNL
ncbi:MAG: DegT/DnrJ/EryC1/StrS family aminotransferase [Bacteroidota bacterium]